jgi:(S)-citramalyl-CoA lyase
MIASRNRRSLMVFSGLAADRKDEARGRCVAAFEAARETGAERDAGPGRLLRMNSPRTVAGIADLAAPVAMTHPPDGLVLPKVGCAEHVRLVADLLDECGHSCELIALIEDQAGVRECNAIASASERLGALFLGSVDLSGELGSGMGRDALYRGRSALVDAASARGIDCIDGPWLDADDLEGLQIEAARLASMGFTGKASYDAQRLPVLHAAFTPLPKAIDHAQRVISAVHESDTGGVRVDGKSVNRANAKAAQRVLKLARRRGVYPGP